MSDRVTIEVAPVRGGWPHPWPNVAELTRALAPDNWTLIGGLMVQLHTVHRGLGVVRPTNDVDIALHIETTRGVAASTADALESLGYRLVDSVDRRVNTAHRWTRDGHAIDVVTSRARRPADTVDVVTAEHAAPSVEERMRGRTMVRIEGGTQALRRTINARLEILPGEDTLVSVPRPFGALVLKAAASRSDSRDRDRHLGDAVALLACVEDPFAERERFAGSDSSRIRHLADALPDGHDAWLTLPPEPRDVARAALRVLSHR